MKVLNKEALVNCGFEKTQDGYIYKRNIGVVLLVYCEVNQNGYISTIKGELKEVFKLSKKMTEAGCFDEPKSLQFFKDK